MGYLTTQKVCFVTWFIAFLLISVEKTGKIRMSRVTFLCLSRSLKFPKYKQRGETSEFILLPEKRCPFLLFWCKSFEKSRKRKPFTMFWHKKKDLSCFVENVCENVLLYLLKLFPFSYCNDFITEKYVFYIESIGKIVFVLSFCVKKFSVKTNVPKNVPRVRNSGFFFSREKHHSMAIFKLLGTTYYFAAFL